MYIRWSNRRKKRRGIRSAVERKGKQQTHRARWRNTQHRGRVCVVSVWGVWGGGHASCRGGRTIAVCVLYQLRVAGQLRQHRRRITLLTARQKPGVHTQAVCLSVGPYLSVYVFFVCPCLSVCLSVCCVSVRSAISCLSVVSVCLSVCLSMSVCSVCPVCVSVCPVCVSASVLCVCLLCLSCPVMILSEVKYRHPHTFNYQRTWSLLVPFYSEGTESGPGW